MRVSNTFVFSHSTGNNGLLVPPNSRFVELVQDVPYGKIGLTFEADPFPESLDQPIVVDKYFVFVGNESPIGDLIGTIGDGLPGHHIGVWLAKCGQTLVGWNSVDERLEESPINYDFD